MRRNGRMSLQFWKACPHHSPLPATVLFLAAISRCLVKLVWTLQLHFVTEFLSCPRPARRRGFPTFRVTHSWFCLHWFEIQKENCLPVAVVPCAVRHPHELRARPRRPIRAK